MMLTGYTKLLRTDFVRTRRRRSTGKILSNQLLECGKLDWEPWTQDDPAGSLVPSDESMAAVAEASRTAYSIMHLTKSQLIKIQGEAGFDDFAEVMGDLANTVQMLRAVVQMIEGAQGRMIVSACACLQNNRNPRARRASHSRKPADRVWKKRRKVHTHSPGHG
jgi:hypothetical protein